MPKSLRPKRAFATSLRHSTSSARWYLLNLRPRMAAPRSRRPTLARFRKGSTQSWSGTAPGVAMGRSAPSPEGKQAETAQTKPSGEKTPRYYPPVGTASCRRRMRDDSRQERPLHSIPSLIAMVSSQTPNNLDSILSCCNFI